MRKRTTWLDLPILAVLFPLFLAAPAAADGLAIDAEVSDTLGDVTTAGPSQQWRYTVGLGAVAVPDYEGSEDYQAAPLPIARVQKGHQYGQLFGLKLTSNLVPDPNFRAGPVINFRPERDDVDNNQVDAMNDVDSALELGVQVGYDYRLDGGVIGVEVEFVHDLIDGHNGWLLTPEVKYRRKLGGNWNLSLSTLVTVASDDYMESYFGVSAADAVASGFPTFNADGGLKDIGVQLALGYDITEAWDAGFIAGWQRLLNDAEDSPVTKAGEENQYLAGLFVTYSWTSK